MQLLVVGASSEIGMAIAGIFARKEGADIYLASRDVKGLTRKARDLEIRYGIKAGAFYFDALEYDSHSSFFESLDPKPDGVVISFGYLGDQNTAQQDFKEAQKIIASNFTGAASILEVTAREFIKRQRGFIIGISSVAGDRGRQSNYIYGSANGALTTYLSGLRNRLSSSNVQVITILPGFVRTKMTEGMDLPERLTALPDEEASDVYRAFKKKKDIIYTKWFWKWIMMTITSILEKVFKKLTL